MGHPVVTEMGQMNGHGPLAALTLSDLHGMIVKQAYCLYTEQNYFLCIRTLCQSVHTNLGVLTL
jgi:hypothetical protein